MPTLPAMKNPGSGHRGPLGAIIAAALFAAACGAPADQSASGPEYGDSLEEFMDADQERASGSSGSAPPPGFTEIQWTDLVPPGASSIDISARFDEKMADVAPGSPEAEQIFAELQAEFNNQPVNPAVAGSDVQLAGFIAPLQYSDELITEFLLVPNFGACIHVPPPPVNQTVMVSLQEGQGLTIEDSWGPVWVAGTLTIDSVATDLATAGYTMTGAQTGVYDQY